MGFAGSYLLKKRLRERLIRAEPHPDLQIIIIIPVYDESGLERCLDSLFRCHTKGIRAEVLVLINASESDPPGILDRNRCTLEEMRVWSRTHSHSRIVFHLLLDHSFKKKEAGVGLARKILMDEAADRFSRINRPGGIIASLDADARVDRYYLQEISKLFREQDPDGCTVYFEHPIKGDEFAPPVYEAIIQYELHLRYYLRSLRFTGTPYAFHTVGSSFAVNAGIYCKEGGMNRRQGGEDFYFIQKVAQRGNFRECTGTCVVPSPRPSARVPFGTGPVVEKLVSRPGEKLLTYSPGPFTILRTFFSEWDQLYNENALPRLLQDQAEVLQDFLEEQQFGTALKEIRQNAATPHTFRKRLWRWFNMFRILKFLHYARERGHPDIPVEEASFELLKHMHRRETGIPGSKTDPIKLLEIYRQLDRVAAY